MTAVNPLRGEARLGNYRLALDVNAFCYAQPVCGMKPLEMVSAFLADPDDLLLTRTLLWASLQKHHACHELEAGEILADIGNEAARSAISIMMGQAFGLKKPDSGVSAEDKEGENPPTKTLGTGTGSTGSTSKRAAKAKRSGVKRPD